MKKISAIIAAIMTVSLITLPVSAADLTLNGASSTGTSTLAYNVSSGYTVTIPASTTLSSGSGTINLSATGVLIGEGDKLSIKVASANYEAANPFRMVADGTNYLNYTIKNGEATIAHNGEVLAVAAGTSSGNSTLTITAAALTKSGDYTDTLTFTSAIVSAS